MKIREIVKIFLSQSLKVKIIAGITAIGVFAIGGAAVYTYANRDKSSEFEITDNLQKSIEDTFEEASFMVDNNIMPIDYSRFKSRIIYQSGMKNE